MVTIDGNTVFFNFYRPGVSEVSVAGEFNNWRMGEIRMKPDGKGNWTAKTPLPCGEYRFRYCADGEWFTDYAANGLEPGRFGMDSLVRIPVRTLKVDTTATQQGKPSRATLAASA
jgi:1,4-alpha-glucan branching enzyme